MFPYQPSKIIAPFNYPKHCSFYACMIYKCRVEAILCNIHTMINKLSAMFSTNEPILSSFSENRKCIFFINCACLCAKKKHVIHTPFNSLRSHVTARVMQQ